MRVFLHICCLCVIAAGSLLFAAEPDRGLTADQALNVLKSVQLDPQTRTAMNAVSNNDIRDVALNRQIIMNKDDLFSFSLPTKGITDQEGSGRCWLFAGLNLMRQTVIRKYDLDKFELSQSYLSFWDKFEKANVFLEFIIETRNRDVLDRELAHMLDDPIGDGGYFGYVANIIGKYGVVPKKFMAESHSSANTGRMDGILRTLLRRDAAVLRKLAAEGKSDAALRGEKMTMLKDVMRVLVINFGMPPTSFLWRTLDDSTHTVADSKVYTPQEFSRDVVGLDLSDFASLGSYPDHPFGKNYSINLTRSMAERSDVAFVNVDIKTLKDYALKALLDSNRVWFGCDMGPDVNGKRGLMIKGLYDYEALFGVPLRMSKAERLDYRHSSSNHAMVLIGVDVVDGKPVRWKVENSWGGDRGDDGIFTMSDEWFDEYVLNVVVPKRYLSASDLQVSRQTPTPLPVWDPVWKSLNW